jgi:Tfp pilus assembly protein PilF
MSSFVWSRREFLFASSAAALLRNAAAAAEEGRPFAVEPPKPGPYELLRRFIQPGQDDYACEKEAMDIEATLRTLRTSQSLPLAPEFTGSSPRPARWRAIDQDIAEAEYDLSNHDFSGGMKQWLAALGDISRLYVAALPDHRVRVEAAGRAADKIVWHVALWQMEWRDGRLLRFQPLEELRSTRAAPLFLDCSRELLGKSPAWREQMLRGTPYWRSRLDSATGIDIYGSQGIAAGDIDGDGWDEIYVSQPGGLPNRLFKRQSDGSFSDIAGLCGVDLLDDTSCALFVDFRNCGLQDLLVLAPGGPLYLANQGGAKFKLMRDAFQFAQPLTGSFTGMSAADYDRDGRVDLYLCTYVYFQSEDRYHYPVPYHDAQAGPPNYLLRNRLNPDGTGYFEDVTESSGINHNNNRYSFAAVWSDYDSSGWPSLYVANDFGRNNLYRNADGQFRDVAKAAGVEDIAPGMCACWFDYDGDTRPDLYVANMWTPAGQRVVADSHFPLNTTPELQETYRRHTHGNSLYRNRGDGTFEEVPEAGGARVGRWAWGSEGIDFDNDGSPEIFGAAGMLSNSKPDDLMSFFWRQTVAKSPLEASPAPDYENAWNSINQYIREEYSWNGREPNVFYVRKGGRFRDVSGLSGLDYADDSRTFAVTDFDNDGCLDLFLKSRLGPQVRALKNNCADGRSAIAFSLRGTKSNRDAIGAIVDVEYGARRARKSLQAGSGYLSQHTKRLHFGLGEEGIAKRVTVRWPSGSQQVFENLKAGSRYEVVEGSSDLKQEPFRRKAPTRPAEDRQGDVEPDNSVALAPTWLLEPVPLPEKRKGPGFLLLTDGRDSAPAGLPVEVLNLTQIERNTAAAYGIFRRYLFDWRAPLTVPLLLLLDAEGRANKIYPAVPSADVLKADLAALSSAGRLRLATPFPGWYAGHPPRNYYKLGAGFLGAGLLDQALPYLETALQQRPDNFKATLAIGQVHLEANRLPQARQYLEKALALNPDSPEALNNMGGVLIGEGHPEEALRCFEKLLRVAPDSTYGLTNAATALTRLNRPADAERLYRRALRHDPRNSETADRLGLLVGQQGRLDEAISLFKQALEYDPKNSSAINNIAVAYMQSGKGDDAVAALQYGIQVAPDYDTLYLNLARIWVNRGDRIRARDVLRRLLDRFPNHAVARQMLQQLGEA